MITLVLMHGGMGGRGDGPAFLLFVIAVVILLAIRATKR
jgi:hypothetical protein